MFTLHIWSHMSSSVRSGLALCWVLLAMALAAQAQTQADCTFNSFSTTTQLKHQDGTPVVMQPLGINDFSTIVGYALGGTASGNGGLIRWANGGVTKVKGTSALVLRNDHGTSVGWGLTLFEAILVNGTTITPIVLGGNKMLYAVTGINRWGTIVGTYDDTSGFPSVKHGYKRWNNGTTHTLDFPGATPSSTVPDGINDNGTVVGQYADQKALLHGFIFHNGQWATLDYPQAVATNLIGITNAGMIIGKARITTPWSDVLFLYENGTFKVISVPNSVKPELLSISPKQGLILAVTDVAPGSPAFIAQCQ